MSRTQAVASKAVDRIAKQVREAVAADIAAQERPSDDGKHDLRNADGDILQCKLTVSKRPGAPDPLVVTVNDEIRWIKRGEQVVVPWYVVLHLKNNIERTFTNEKVDGRDTPVASDSPSEPISYTPINPHPENPDWL